MTDEPRCGECGRAANCLQQAPEHDSWRCDDCYPDVEPTDSPPLLESRFERAWAEADGRPFEDVWRDVKYGRFPEIGPNERL